MTYAMDSEAASRLARALSTHARARMLERGIGVAEVVSALREIASVLRDANGLTVTGVNGVTVVCDIAGTVVITVLPRESSPARWRGPDEGVAGYRRDGLVRRNRTRGRVRTAGTQVTR